MGRKLYLIITVLACLLPVSGQEDSSSCLRADIEIAERAGDTQKLAGLYYKLGEEYYYLSRYDTAIIYYRRVLEVVEDHDAMDNGRELKIKSLTDIGNVYNIQGQTTEALQHYLSALDMAEKYELRNLVVDVYANIGQIYLTMENFQQVEVYFTRMKDLCTELNDSLSMAYAFDGLVELHLHNGELEKALECAEAANRIVATHPDAVSSEKLTGLLSLAAVWFEGYHNDEKALMYAEPALKYAEECRKPLFMAHALCQISSIYLSRKDYKAAEQAALRALDADSSSFYITTVLHENIAKANIMMGNKAKAIAYFDRHKNWLTIFSNKNYQSALTEMEVKYENRKKELQIETQKTIISRQNLQHIALLAGIAVFALLLVLVERLRRLQSKRNRELAQMNATKDKFFSLISHDLKNPAIAQRNTLQGLIDHIAELDAASLQLYLKELLKSADEQVELLCNLLNWAQVQTGMITYHPSLFDLGETARSQISLLELTIHNKSIRFTSEIPDGLFAFGDYTMIASVIRNLLTNAIKFTPTGGEIRLTIKEQEEEYIVTVEDKGVGMNKTMLHNLFSLNKQSSRQGTNGEQSNGLGLIICKELVEKNGGTLTIESEEDVGSSFRFSIKKSNS